MLNIIDQIKHHYSKDNANKFKAIIEIISKAIGVVVFIFTFVVSLAFVFALVVLVVLLLTYDKSSYNFISLVNSYIKGGYVYGFYFEQMHSLFAYFSSQFELTSNIAKSKNMPMICATISTLCFYITIVQLFVGLVYSNLRMTFANKIIDNFIVKKLKDIFNITVGLLPFMLSRFVAYYIYKLIKNCFYILAPMTLIVSALYTLFGNIIFTSVGMTYMIIDMTWLASIPVFAVYVFKALIISNCFSIFFDLVQSTTPTGEINQKSKYIPKQYYIKMAGLQGENKFKEKLDKMDSNYISSNNMLFGESWVAEIDFLVFVQNVGLIVVEVKNYTGDITCTNADKWERVKYDNYGNDVGVTQESNVSKQVLSTANQFERILRKNKIYKYKVIPVVVFANDKVNINVPNVDNKPQTDVLTINQFDRWVSSIELDKSQLFDDDTITEISEAIENAEIDYTNSTHPKVLAIKHSAKDQDRQAGVH